MSARPRYAGPTADDGEPRLFVAALLPESAAAVVRELVDAIQADVEAQARAPRSAVRWVRLDGLHLTLRFLGPTPDERVPELAAAVDRAAAGRDPIGLVLRGAGAFPSPARPRAVWIGVDDPMEELARLAAAVEDELAAMGWERNDRPFHPHLTLARCDGRREGPLVADLLATRARTLDAPFEVGRVGLFESVTGGGPARYVPRHEARLDGSAVAS